MASTSVPVPRDHSSIHPHALVFRIPRLREVESNSSSAKRRFFPSRSNTQPSPFSWQNSLHNGFCSSLLTCIQIQSFIYPVGKTHPARERTSPTQTLMLCTWKGSETNEVVGSRRIQHNKDLKRELVSRLSLRS